MRQVSGILTWVKLDVEHGRLRVGGVLARRVPPDDLWPGSLPTAVISKESLANQNTVSPLRPLQLNGRVKAKKTQKGNVPNRAEEKILCKEEHCFEQFVLHFRNVPISYLI